MFKVEYFIYIFTANTSGGNLLNERRDNEEGVNAIQLKHNTNSIFYDIDPYQGSLV